MIISTQETGLIIVLAVLVKLSLRHGLHKGIGVSDTLINGRPYIIYLNGAGIVSVILEKVCSQVSVEIAQIVIIGIHRRIVVTVELLPSHNPIDTYEAIFHFILGIIERV